MTALVEVLIGDWSSHAPASMAGMSTGTVYQGTAADTFELRGLSRERN